MSDRSAGVRVWQVDAVDGWEPDEETGGSVRMIRTSTAVTVGLWRPNGMAGKRIAYRLDSDETLVVLSGTGEVRVDDAKPIPLHPGVAVSLPRGTHLSWLVDEDFRELWIYS